MNSTATTSPGAYFYVMIEGSHSNSTPCSVESALLSSMQSMRVSVHAALAPIEQNLSIVFTECVSTLVREIADTTVLSRRCL
jgi:hypothetical protein